MIVRTNNKWNTKKKNKFKNNPLMYYLLTERFKSQEKQLVDIILKIGNVDSIYMLGSTLSRRRTESIFLTAASSCDKVSHYYLLVLITKPSDSNNSIQDKIENTCHSFIPVTVIVLNIDQFIIWLIQGHSFATTVQKKAVPLYETIPLQKITGVMEDQVNNSLICDSKPLTEALDKEFLAGAEFYLARKQHNLSLFMLHQAMEHLLLLYLKKKIGLQFNTHDLIKLIRYCAMVSYKIPDIFSMDNSEAQRLFQLLQKRYINTRYKDGVSITSQDILSIIEKIKSIQKVLLDS
ncbi:MAG: HEPN domain-containing protein [Ferruginibacter sp.]